MKLDEFMKELEMDAKTTRARFMNMDKMLLKFLRKFPEDHSFNDLTEAMKVDDWNCIERAAHTIKGVAGNLGLEDVRRSGQEMVDDVRAGNYDRLPGEYAELSEAYEKTCSLIAQLED
ncbi:MAG: Hpt domain-containing protein [Clostridia bacterium]|nr:Hpt domain-containing protein [Clostridia bacterium]NCC42621.1 Hpt domain-containing protein [Clostridia bacterium]